mmetsp:Transcript_5171/g.9499  ORF Transcript_5171/g.9499 Transcript_5171/m.9499 type:complete len:326 (+) Transcript_5171:2239-3216(+)
MEFFNNQGDIKKTYLGKDKNYLELQNSFKSRNKNYYKSNFYHINELKKRNFNLFYENVNSLIIPLNERTNLLSAQIENVKKNPYYYISLSDKISEIKGVEHLMSSLEGCSIDNCEIILKGGNEIPILEGSSIGFINEVIKAGIMYSSDNIFVGDKTYQKRRRKFRFSSDKAFAVNHNESFISYYPDTTTKITVGVDMGRVAPIIGKQWFSFDMYEDDHYRWEIAPARMYISSLEELYLANDLGYFKNGINNCVNIACKSSWNQFNDIRFFNSECARHEILDIIGCLKLLTYNGNGGIPYGHIIAYKPSLSMVIRFIKTFKESFIY